MIRIDQIKIRPLTEEGLLKKAASLLKVRPGDISFVRILRRSVDARKKPDVVYTCSILISAHDEDKILKRVSGASNISRYEPVTYSFPIEGKEELKDRPLIVGMGPAGLFCAYELAKYGYRPLVIERGKCAEERREDVKRFWETGVLDKESNVQFGEGGAGTFSDGKLNTTVKDKNGRVTEVLTIFAENGAPGEILYDAHPHLGTDILPDIVSNIREKIKENGGEVRFETRLAGIDVRDGRVVSVILESPEGTETVPVTAVILATGHSARDTYEMLYDAGLKMEPKPFAAGFRVQHPQSFINISQYGSDEAAKDFGASPYKLTANFGDRGVFSFCMCPGGYVVNSSSEPGETVVNGMSYSGRDSENANSAIVVSIPVSEYGSDHPLAGIEYQRKLERRAYELAGGRIPAQRYSDFKKAVTGIGAYSEGDADNRNGSGDVGYSDSPQEMIRPVFKGDYEWCDLSGIFDGDINRLFIDGMDHFGKVIKGFDRPDAIMAGVESRTSSPVRIPRDENMESGISGIIPAGEGAGYAGGITSAAVDGLRAAEAVARRYAPFR